MPRVGEENRGVEQQAFRKDFLTDLQKKQMKKETIKQILPTVGFPVLPSDALTGSDTGRTKFSQAKENNLLIS